MKIDKGVSVSKSRAGRPAKYPFREMSIGDSIFVAGENSQGRASRAAQQAKINGVLGGYATRTVDGGVRIWRTA